MTLRARLTLVAATAVAVAVVVAALLAFGAARRVLYNQVDDSLEDRAADLDARRDAFLQQTTPGNPIDGDEPFEVGEVPLPAFGAAGGFTQFVTGTGIVIRAGNETGELPVSNRAEAVAGGDANAYFETASVDGERVRVYTVPFGDNLALQVARPLDEVDRVLRNLRLALLIVVAGGVVLAAGIGFVVARTALHPVDRLTAAAEDVTETLDLSRRIDVSTGDELGRLATSFNTMLGALEESVDAQRRLVADTSHELRTPLTSLRTNVALLTREEELSPEDAADVRRDIDVQIAELSSLIGNVIDLARGEERTHREEPVRLDQLVASALEQASFHWPEVHFTADLAPCTVTGDPDRLASAVTNLLDNAGKWSPSGESVEVRVVDGVVDVRDHGPGVDPSDAPYVFDRFWRSPAARAKPGSGLGLAIVRQVARAHGGEATVEPADGGGARFTIRLPADS